MSAILFHLMNEQWPTNQPPQQKMNITIIEDPDIAQGRYAHVFVTSYDDNAKHFRIDFYQDSMPTAGINQTNRRLVARIFLTYEGLAQLGGILTDLHQRIADLKKTQLPAGSSPNSQ